MSTRVNTGRDDYDVYVAALQTTAGTARLPTDDEIDALVTAGRNVVLSIYNNVLRACGVPVGDADSESNCMYLDGGLAKALRDEITNGLADRRELRLREMEQRRERLAKELAELDTAIKTARRNT